MVKPGRWLPLIVVAWGTVTTLTALIHDFAGLIAIRFFLGLCEGALLPGIVCHAILLCLWSPTLPPEDSVSQLAVQAT